MFETPGGTQVIAPLAGRVIYADAFRSYGNLVIVQVCDLHVLLAGLATVQTSVGSNVETGTTVALMSPAGARGAPVLYVEVRRNGVPIDPEPLFAD